MKHLKTAIKTLVSKIYLRPLSVAIILLKNNLNYNFDFYIMFKRSFPNEHWLLFKNTVTLRLRI